MYPLRFQPIFRRYIWGGRRLATALDKPIGPEDDYAESWEVVDRREDQSTILYGSLAGHTLEHVIHQSGIDLLGPEIWSQVSRDGLPSQLRTRFPLLLKFLDANRTLSVQVHPTDEIATKQSPPDLGKTEAWYVIEADPGSVIYAGLKEGVDRKALQHAVATQTTDEVLNQISPSPGDCIFIPAGTVHAIGSGLLIAEIQQCSDTTYRLFDWNRVDSEGRARPLHIDAAINVTDYVRGPVRPQPTKPTSLKGVNELVSCDKFVMRHWVIDSDQTIETDKRFRLLSVIRGSMNVVEDPSAELLKRGESMLIPACLESASLSPIENCEFLEITVP